ncbi:maltose ABC transporter permease [Marinitoga sp. 1135]|uniref:Maltose/maltodextrin transport system permease protein n=1 Tax=Marinitoga piezophila (strain DSM 14283 / JCM 11233 / KA3) TaxID=443254 RepID=H2J4Z2_MARPK|nr:MULTISPECIES: ABC transporter permease subunit [Marinitoga]AEX86009.1 permease component of ABC-type sugar transporter [Marinitoga piezophila KA3]NUU96198.1 maltose ABC transporter permease [Marinitoga sp. 1135]NUU98121.1 maltose ABC transporter permease [Marinitoga sp. 1138]
MKFIGKALLYSFIALLNAGLIWTIFILSGLGNYGLAVVIAAFTILANIAIFSKKGYPYRYTLPAMFFLFILTVYPIYYTVKTAFTNYGTGHLFTRDQAIQILLEDPNYLYEPQNGENFNFKVFVVMKDFKPTEDFLILLYNDDKLLLAQKPSEIKTDAKGNTKLAVSELYEISKDKLKANINGEIYTAFTRIAIDETFKELPLEKKAEEIIGFETDSGKKYVYFYSPIDRETFKNAAFYNSVLRQKYIGALELKTPEGKSYRLSSRYIYKKFNESYRIYELRVKPIYKNNKKTYKTIIFNTRTNRELVEKDGAFWDYNENGKLERLIGYSHFVGAYQFKRIKDDPKISGPFLKIFGWTFTYAALSVLFSFIIGMILALMLNDKNMKGRILYRTLLIIPWAVPAFISVLIWRNGFFNETYGILNRFVITTLGLEPIKWLNDPFWAKVAVLIVNTWLGFPYMMTITLGALQSIPDELYEAASIDGATRWTQFKKITLPLLMVSLTPLLVSSFAFNFNNFVNIYLLTGGGPAMPGATTPAGSTDILISYTYKLAFEGSRGQDFGFASAISILIFAIVSGISYFNFKLSGAFEEVSR